MAGWLPRGSLLPPSRFTPSRFTDDLFVLRVAVSGCGRFALSIWEIEVAEGRRRSLSLLAGGSEEELQGLAGKGGAAAPRRRLAITAFNMMVYDISDELNPIKIGEPGGPKIEYKDFKCDGPGLGVGGGPCEGSWRGEVFAVGFFFNSFAFFPMFKEGIPQYHVRQKLNNQAKDSSSYPPPIASIT